MAQQPAAETPYDERLGELTHANGRSSRRSRALSRTQIAELLFIEESTVRPHVERNLMKLHLRDRVQAVILAYEKRAHVGRVRLVALAEGLDGPVEPHGRETAVKHDSEIEKEI